MRSGSSALLSKLSPQKAQRSPDGLAALPLSPQLMIRRALQAPLPEKVSPLKRGVLIRSSPARVRDFLIESFEDSENQYDEDGCLQPQYVEKIVKAKSPRNLSQDYTAANEKENIRKDMMSYIMERDEGEGSLEQERSEDNSFDFRSDSLTIRKSRAKAQAGSKASKEDDLASSSGRIPRSSLPTPRNVPLRTTSTRRAPARFFSTGPLLRISNNTVSPKRTRAGRA